MNVTLEYKCFAKRVYCVGNVYVFAYKQIIDDKMWYGLHEKISYIILLIGLKLLWLKISFDDTTLREQQWN